MPIDRELYLRAIGTLRAGPRGDIAWMIDPLVFALILPSFRPPVAYEAWSEDGRALVTRTTWRRDLDGDRQSRAPTASGGAPLPPTIEVADAVLDADVLDPLVATVVDAAVPGIARAREGGLDGTSYELALTLGSATAHFKWCSTPPRVWEPLGAFLRDFTRLADSVVRPRTNDQRSPRRPDGT